MLELGSKLVVKRPTNCEWLIRQGEKTFELDLATIHTAEARRRELANVTYVSGRELASCFNGAYDAACKLHALVTYELNEAVIAARKRRAILLRDELPGRIRDRGLSSARAPLGAEDIRKDMLYEDKEYVEMEQYRGALEAIKELLFGKMMALRADHEVARAVIGHGRNSNELPGSQQDPDGDTVNREMVRVLDENPNTTTQPAKKRGWGIPRD